VYGIWVQPVDDFTSAENLELYGEIDQFDDMYDDGRAKEFCDGQTSPSGPRWADDRMGMLWTKNRETAEFIQGILRDQLTAEISGGLAVTAAPSWISGAAAMSLAPSALVPAIRTVRKKLDLAEDVTDSQVETALKRYVNETGGQLKDAPEWIAANTGLT